MQMIDYDDSNDDKLKTICEIVGLEKFLEITEAINRTVYIPQKNRFVRKLILQDSHLFLETLDKIGSLQGAAKKFCVSTRTISNWIHKAVHTKKSPSKKGRDENADKLARSLL